MKRLEQLTIYLPWLGLLLLIGATAVYIVSGRWDNIVNLLMVGGGLALFLFALLRPDEVRQLVSGRQVRYGGNTLLAILFFVAIAVLLYVIAYQNSDWRYDVTETREFTPLEETRQLLEQLDEPVRVLGFYSFQRGAQREMAREMLESLQAYSQGQLQVEFIDPDENPVLAQQYGISLDGTLVFVKGEGETAVTTSATTLTDRAIHTALLRVIYPVEKTAYFLTGQGQRDIEDFSPDGLARARTLLEDSGFIVQTLNLFIAGQVPDDADVILLIDQFAPMTPNEVAAIAAYLEEGGAAFIARDVAEGGRIAAEGDGLNEMLTENWGVRLRDDIIIEQVMARAGAGFGLTFIGASYGTGPIISPDLPRFGTAFEVARSVGVTFRSHLNQIPLVSTSAEAWGETDIQALASQGIAEPGPGDTEGPLHIGVSVQNNETNGRLVVFGDTDFISNGMITQGGNSLLFTNAVNWLAGDEVAVEITPRQTIERQLVISQVELVWLQLVSICLGPLLMLIAGLFVWYSRRQTV
jgi:ABC-type uncharacterized transport system involved in gliding motility auxiliary subunit